ncbi:DUF262 domain-containing protein [Exiguobacterium sp. SL-10]|uniref:DUF262 domain-containing protein n=1 Tax=Exiguobacterium sp. SL-10 TaxID=2510962 RepID=UPI00103D53D0|nr:DUF262 domain-containing protein [Exiguobacterium sp. SL-10]TCI31535.1 DUF262 domain-containing protein [Exiguobacterium sp. SL-10]
MSIIQNDKIFIGSLLSNRNPFVIPKHQRAYSWEDEQVETFCDDLQDITNEEYFFGGLVSVHEPADNAPGRIYRVVDGQQRLATFTMLIAQLRNGYIFLESQARQADDQTSEDTAKSLADDLNNTYLTYMDTHKRPPVRENRLTLSKVDSDFFKQLLLTNNNLIERDIAESHKKIVNSWNMINRKLIEPIINNEDISTSEKLDNLNTLKDKILEQSVLIHIVCDNLDEAYQLFEVLNDRGKELATGDYLRSFTLEILETNSDLQNRASDYWDNILSRKGAEKFLKTYLISHNAQAPRNNIHRKFQTKFFRFSDDATDIGRLTYDRIQNIKNTFDIYEYLIDGSWPYNDSTTLAWEKNRLSLLIKQLGHTLCIPLLMAIYETGSEIDFKKTVLELEKVSFRYIVVSNLRANNLSQIYNKHILSMRRTNHYNLDELKLDLKALLDVNRSDALFASSLESKLIYKNTSSNRKKIRYFLTTLEDYNHWFTSGATGIPEAQMHLTTNIDSIDLEHIYPQNPRHLDENIEPLKHSISNLTFWSPADNKSASNLDFQNKKTFYETSSISLTNELTQYADWDLDSLESRKQKYIDLALLVFKVY